MKVELLKSADKFHRLAKCAARNGGFWVAAAGGTANVIAGTISGILHVDYQDAHRALDLTAHMVWESENWYQAMAEAQPWPLLCIPETARWDARTIAKAACRQ